MPRIVHVSPINLTSFRRQLLAWFDRFARALPWRATRDPYAIWVSEVMLQQTQAATVIPYFKRFLKAFPNLSSLARASEQDVLNLWQGLGYYHRAKSLHQAALTIFSRHAGIFPTQAADLSDLPGLGRYTVNAVLSQAFDQRLPILEANTERVICRLLAIRDDPKKTATRHRLWEASANLLPLRRVGAFNQALMELGALICKPTSPACPACPVRRWCEAQVQGIQHRLPVKSPKKAIEVKKEVGLVLWRGGEVLWTQRAPGGRWPSMWEFPHVPLAPGESHQDAAQRLLTQLGLRGQLGPAWTTLHYAVTRFRITLTCYQGRFRAGRFRPNDTQAKGLWILPERLGDFPVSAPQRKLVDRLAKESAGLPP